MVKSGQLSTTASDFDILAVELAFGDALKASLVLKKGIHRAFATRKKSPRLLSALNLFVKKQLTLQGKTQMAPVAKPAIAIKKAPKSKAHISTLHTPFDGRINEAAKSNKLDPRLLKAVIQTGSNFDPHAVSSIGETGLMQLLPHIPAQVGLPEANLHTPKDNLRVGAAYLAHLLRTLEPGLPAQTRLQFALAAYKVGQGHVDDARRLAKTVLGMDPNRWAKNVARALPLLSHRRYARQAKHGYCRGEGAVTFVTAVTKLITGR
ncbi:MAG TPA: hypothetical protein EYN66_15180 [Myxococcales bacterium]|nr:hypothetical protein [Myxococcales bacterium]